MLFLLDFIGACGLPLCTRGPMAMYGPLEDTLAHAGPHQLGITVQYSEPGVPCRLPSSTATSGWTDLLQ